MYSTIKIYVLSIYISSKILIWIILKFMYVIYKNDFNISNTLNLAFKNTRISNFLKLEFVASLFIIHGFQNCC